MRNIIITGGELFNKGAQAMVFVAVDELKKRFPDHEIYVLSEMDRRRPKEELEQYAFRFTGWYPIKFAKAQSDPLLKLACKFRNGAEYRECEALYKNCDLMVDISGYGLGSNWDINQLTTYADHLEYAKEFHIPTVLMPQSFGPFDFEGKKSAVGSRFPELLRYVKVICAREQQGYDALVSSFGLTNVRIMPDLVLNNKSVDLGRIFRKIPRFELPEIPEGAVALIPNERIASAVGQEMALTLYITAMKSLLKTGRPVILLRHAEADRSLCQAILNGISEDGIVFLDRDFSCLEYNELVKQFHFIVASRFHAIVHAYKNGVPAIALGWADKYRELMKCFGQEAYAIDVRDHDCVLRLPCAVETVDKKSEKERILEGIREFQKTNVFDVIDDLC